MAEQLAEVIELVRVCDCCGLRLPPADRGWVRVIRPSKGPVPFCVTCAAAKAEVAR